MPNRSDRVHIVRTEEATTSRMRRRFFIILKKDRRVKLSVGLIPVFVTLFLLAAYVYPVISQYPGATSTENFYLNTGSQRTLTYIVDLPTGAEFNINTTLSVGTEANFTLTEQSYSTNGLGKVVTIASGTLTSAESYTYKNSGPAEVAKYTVSVTNDNGGYSKETVNFAFSSYFTVLVNPYLMAAGIMTLVVAATIMGLTMTSISKKQDSYFNKVDVELLNSKRSRSHKTSFRYEATGDNPIHPLVFLAFSMAFIAIGFLLNRGTYALALLSYAFMALGGAIFLGAILFWIMRME